MRVKDSLERGVSYFYAEVRRLKRVLDGPRPAPGEALFLVDEMLLGTNTRERQLASREVLRLLLADRRHRRGDDARPVAGRAGERAGEHGRNVHFRDVLEDGRMRFDYRLRQGVVDTTNALRVLALAGIPVRDDARE